MSTQVTMTQEQLDAAIAAAVEKALQTRPQKLLRSKLFVNGASSNPKAPTHSGTLDLPDGSAWHAVVWQQDDNSIVLRFQTEAEHLAERAAWKARQRAA